MDKLLKNISQPRDVQYLNLKELMQLADECRRRIIEVTSKRGGHLASSLGAVEITIALFKLFDLEQDRIVWDVGHQAYTHKLLTGRNEDFDTLTESGSDQAAIARELNVSVRQLQRELQERGLTFKGLVEEVRRELAISYLTEKQKSIGEITYLLGYTEPANFGRSFKKWTGQTPAAFRASA